MAQDKRNQWGQCCRTVWISATDQHHQPVIRRWEEKYKLGLRLLQQQKTFCPTALANTHRFFLIEHHCCIMSKMFESARKKMCWCFSNSELGLLRLLFHQNASFRPPSPRTQSRREQPASETDGNTTLLFIYCLFFDSKQRDAGRTEGREGWIGF